MSSDELRWSGFQVTEEKGEKARQVMQYETGDIIIKISRKKITSVILGMRFSQKPIKSEIP